MADIKNDPGPSINEAQGEELYGSLFADTGSREVVSIKDWTSGWPAIVGGINGIPTSRQFNTLQYITDIKCKLLYLDLEDFKREIRARLDSLVIQNGEISEIIKPLIRYRIATDQDIDDIIAAAYENDTDFVSMLDIAGNHDIDDIIDGVYEDAGGDGPDMATDADIDAIIEGTYVEEEEEEEYDPTSREIEKIVDDAFRSEG